MIKGVGKQIVLLNNTESDIFEQAIFILRACDKIAHKDVVKECERMMNSHIREKRGKPKKNLWKIGFFVLLVALIALSIYCIIK